MCIFVLKVSHAVPPADRFDDANDAILRANDVLVCLVRTHSAKRRGGVFDLIEKAVRLGKPLLQLDVSIVDGRAELSPLPPLALWAQGARFAAPGTPKALAGLQMSAPGPRGERPPTALSFIEAIKTFTSHRARDRAGLFKRGAVVIILFHVIATSWPSVP